MKKAKKLKVKVIGWTNWVKIILSNFRIEEGRNF
jgi:hypothetical protein